MQQIGRDDINVWVTSMLGDQDEAYLEQPTPPATPDPRQLRNRVQYIDMVEDRRVQHDGGQAVLVPYIHTEQERWEDYMTNQYGNWQAGYGDIPDVD